MHSCGSHLYQVHIHITESRRCFPEFMYIVNVFASLVLWRGGTSGDTVMQRCMYNAPALGGVRTSARVALELALAEFYHIRPQRYTPRTQYYKQLALFTYSVQ